MPTASSSSAATATSTAVADAPPPPTTTPTATPTTSFVKLNLIYYCLLIYHYVDRANHAFLWRNWSLLDHFVLNLFDIARYCESTVQNRARDIARACSVDPQYRTSTCDIACTRYCGSTVQYCLHVLLVRLIGNTKTTIPQYPSNSLMTQLTTNMSQISGLTFDSSSEDDNDAIVLEPPTAAAAAVANLPPSIAH